MKLLQVFSVLIVALSVLLINGCDSAYYGIISRSISDPIADIPRVAAFSSMDGIPVSWDQDPLADSYVLYRQTLPTGPVKSVYSGTDTSYFDSSMDNDVTEKTMYKYWLAKVRGSKEFPKGIAVIGAFDSTVVKDKNGNNDTKEKAIEFTNYEITDTLPYYSVNNDTLSDVDWFYATVPPNRTLILNMWIGNFAPAVVKVYIAQGGQTGADQYLANGGTIQLNNGDGNYQKVYFCCRPNTSTVGTGSTITYSLSFKTIDIYTHQ